MSKTTRILISSSIIYFSLFAFVGFVHAQGNGNGDADSRREAREARQADIDERKADREENKMERQEERAEKASARCEQIRERVKNRMGNMEQHRENHVTRYNAVSEKLDEIISNLNDKDVDTSELESALATLEGLISEYAVLYSDLVDALSAHSDVDCDSLERGDRSNALENAKGKLGDVKAKRQEIRDFYSTEIRGIIQELREELAASRPAAGEEI